MAEMAQDKHALRLTGYGPVGGTSEWRHVASTDDRRDRILEAGDGDAC